MSLTLLARKRIRNKTSIAPTEAEKTVAKRLNILIWLRNKPVWLPKKSITKATPSPAPELIPRIEGPARGFLKSVCISSPPTARPAPVRQAVIASGILLFIIIFVHAWLSISALNKILSTSLKGIFTEPTEMLIINNRTSPMIKTIISKVLLLYFNNFFPILILENIRTFFFVFFVPPEADFRCAPAFVYLNNFNSSVYKFIIFCFMTGQHIRVKYTYHICKSNIRFKKAFFIIISC